jgi:hypothetical protein
MRSAFARQRRPGSAIPSPWAIRARRSPAAQFPEAGVGAVEERGGLLAQDLEAAEQPLVADGREPAVVERVRGGQDGGAVHVVLDLPVRLVADAHRAHAAIAGKRVHDALLEVRLAADAVDGLQPAVAARRDVDDVAEVALHRPRGVQPVERVHHEVGVAQPAVAVVPVAPAVGRLGYGGGQGGDHRAGVVVGGELERDGRADDLVLPLERDGQAAHPFLPVVPRELEEVAGHLRHGALQRLVGAHHERHAVAQDEWHLLEDGRDRAVRREAQHVRSPHVADVVGAGGHLRAAPAVVVGGPHEHADARAAGDRAHDPDQLRRAEEAPELAEARREIDDLHRAAPVVEKPRHEDGRVGQVVLLGAREPGELDAHEAEIGFAAALAQQRAEHGIAVEAREARPHDLARAVDQRADARVADDAEVQVAHAGCLNAWAGPPRRPGARASRAPRLHSPAATARASAPAPPSRNGPLGD